MQLSKSFSPRVDSREDREIRATMMDIIVEFFDRKGIFDSYELIRQMMIKEAMIGRPGIVEAKLKEEYIKWGEVTDGFEVLQYVRR